MIAVASTPAPTSPAVMAQRHEPHDSLDFFPTPAWATRALCEFFLAGRLGLSMQTVWEPACGEGHMAEPLREYFADVRASDVHAYGYGIVEDFLFPSDWRADWIITNPPFRLALEFALTALARAELGVALLVRLQWLEGIERYHSLFAKHPPRIVAQFVERVPMRRGWVDPDVSSATAYAWIIWDKREGGQTHFAWIPPCRAQLQRLGDYAIPEIEQEEPAGLPLFAAVGDASTRADHYQTPTPKTEGNHHGP